MASNDSNAQSQSSASPRGSTHETSRDELQKRLQRFKRKMNKQKGGSTSGRTTPTSSIGGPPSEYGRALSTASVPAFRFKQSNDNGDASCENQAVDDINRTMASRAQLIKSLLAENEKLKLTLEQWTPVVSAYRTCHALVQDLNTNIEEKDLNINKLNESVKEAEQRASDVKLKLIEYERRMELKDAALNQLKSKIIEQKSQLENVNLTEADLRRQLGDRSRFLDQIQKGSSLNPPVQNQQQAAMAMMTMQLQKEMTECMGRLKEREQEVAVLSSERDNLVDACNQLQEALKAATSAAVVPIPMEMTFKPGRSELVDQESQTITVERPSNLSNGETSTVNIQTEPFSLPNCSSVQVQFSSIDIVPIAINIPEDHVPCPFPSVNFAENIVVCDNACQCDTACDGIEVACQCSLTECPVVCDNATQIYRETENDKISCLEMTPIQSDYFMPSDRVDVSESYIQTDAVEVSDGYNDPHLIISENETQTDLCTGADSVTQTHVIETIDKSVEIVKQSLHGATQTELNCTTSDVATDAEYSIFSMSDALTQSEQSSSGDMSCQTETLDFASSDLPAANIQAFENAPDYESRTIFLGADSVITEKISVSSTTEKIKLADFSCQVVFSSPGAEAALEDRPRSRPESVLSLASEVTSNMNSSMDQTGSQKTPSGPFCPTELDALRAAVKLLSREKRDLQSRLAYLSKSKPSVECTPINTRASTTLNSPPKSISAISPSPVPLSISDNGVHSSLSAIQRKICELREQLAAVNHNPSNIPS